MDILISVVGVFFTLGIVIFIHEFGHFIICKAVGVKVLKFSFGFGKEIFGFTRNETRYSVNWIPLGGYVKPAGEDYLEKDTAEAEPPKPDEYFGKPWYQRLLIVIAGPFMNYVLAVFIFTMVFWIWGGNPQFLDTSVIGGLKPGMPAAQAGLEVGDRIIEIEGNSINTWKEMAEIIHKKSDEPLLLKIKRDDQDFELTIIPQLDKENGIGLIGIYPDVQLQDIGLFLSMKHGFQMTWMITVKTIGYILSKIRQFEKPEDVSGPIGIFKFISDAARAGFREFLSLLGLLSVAIGLFNLFPIPLLDGGHMVFYLIEGILRKPLNKRVMLVANYVGMAILLTILLYASYNDILRLRRNKIDTPAAESNK